MNGGEEAGAACCGICCLCGFSALSSWCNMGSYGGRGGRRLNGCCGSCCNDSFNEDSMDRWDKDKANLRTETSQPAPSESMKITQPSAEPVPTSTPPLAPAAPAQTT
ncbi:hypothetical protein B0H15DRAFT_867908 [Mycena belliarum]|uniref:Uncharacterized protein n=1 Tax=Mycena belliarum TaxID=1033014 RepID=A0AAD6TTJ4_9AGAR|nr:hypothetical protein B0H15DRAFT_867908 [Mycena belliae]